ncbi:MAG: DUF2244 domain-containing protein [Acetobacteraceae bacterium]|nr:DUF2244 domain-containing protein [Acetobacteraceae bacterium]
MNSQQEATVFEAMIVPHRSLSRQGRRLLIAVICLGGLMNAGLALAVGAWPAAGFYGLEIGLAVLLFALNMRAARASELVLLTESRLRIVRSDAYGRRMEREWEPSWLRVHLQERPGRVPQLLLRLRGMEEEIGASLGEAEKRELAAALQEALYRWRNPVFDNPQLRA